MRKKSAAVKEKRKSNPIEQVKKSGSRSTVTIVVAVMLFLITFLIQFVATNILPANQGEITDWRFSSGTDPQAISGELTTYRQATAGDRVSKQFGAPYVRLQYTLPAQSAEMRLVIKTAYNPIRVEVDGEQVLQNGYGEKTFTGNSYQSILLPAGDARTLDLYVYAPLAFSIKAYLEPAQITMVQSFTYYIGFGASIAVILLGIGMFLFSIFLAAKSRHIRCLLLLSITVCFAGLTALLYTYSSTTMLLTASYWFFILLLSELLLMMLGYITIAACYKNSLKNAAVFIPVAIFSFIIPLFATTWAVRAAAVVMTAAQLFLAIKANRIFANTTTQAVPHIKVIRGMLIYFALISIYNTIALFLGIGLLSGYLFSCSVLLLCAVMFVVYCRQVVYLDIRNLEREHQLYVDTVWAEDVSELITKMFSQKDETTFLIETAHGLSAILERNLNAIGESVNVHVCVGVYNGSEFVEILNDGPVENCDYISLYKHLKDQPQKLLIGNTTAEMLFQANDHSVIIHFENILCGISRRVENTIRTVYLNLLAVFQNLNLEKDVSAIQEELFINLATVVEQKYRSTKKHLVVVAALSYELCKNLGMSDERANLISLAAMTHDIGKIFISEQILEKESPLTEDEFEQMKQHTEAGFNILSLQKGVFFEMAATIAQQHHENFDGSGYIGLSGRMIAPEARLVRVIDVVDALLSKRSYKDAWSAEQVKNYIAQGKNTLFDPTVVDAFLACADDLLALRTHIIEDESI